MNTETTRRKKLWRNKERGKVMGVCAGLADYLGVPANLLRVLAVLSLFLGLFVITLVVYFVLGFMLDVRPTGLPNGLTPGEQLDALERALADDEASLRDIERYVTSETFSVRSRFRQL